MIQITKYGIANLMAMGGIVLVTIDSPYPILYTFVGGLFIGNALKLARQYGQENENSKKHKN
jgi:hypothetical protein